jgi:hypothetical protein
MTISTAGDLISLALRTAGILGQGQTAAAEDMSDGLSLLNMMLAQWQRKRWLVWSLVDTAVISTGAASYNVGPGQPFNIARPDRIDAAFVRLLGTSPNPVDYPLAMIGSREDYAAIALKSLSTFPAGVFYESSFPVGVLHFWPIPPASQYELHITTKAQITSYAQTDALALPPEYIEAALYSLAVRLAINYGLPASADHAAAMRAALNTIRQANVQTGVMSTDLPRSRSGSVAALSDPRFVAGAW